MTNVAFSRRSDVPPAGEAPTSYAEIAAAVGGGAVPKIDALSSRIQSIANYIPTEVSTLYIAVLAAIEKPEVQEIRKEHWCTFWTFLGITPVVVWLSYAGKVRKAAKPLPVSPWKWPLWEMCSATIAYAAWAFALPKTPFAELPWYSSALAGVLVLVVTTFLGLVAPIVAGTLPP